MPSFYESSRVRRGPPTLRRVARNEEPNVTRCTLTPEQLARLVIANTLRVAVRHVRTRTSNEARVIAGQLESMAVLTMSSTAQPEIESLVKACVADFERMVRE